MSFSLDGLSAPVRFSAKLEAAIKDVLPSTDPFDSADFDATAHINRLFPTEESLSEVEPKMLELQDQMKVLDEEVLQTVRQARAQWTPVWVVVDGSTEKVDGQDVYQIRDMKLYEVSVVTVGANQETEILSVKQLPTVADRLLADVKAGRVLSAKNESELRGAHEALGRVLSVLDSTPSKSDQSASEPDPSRQSHDDSPVKSAPTIAPAEVEGDADEDESEEEIRVASPTPSVDLSILPEAIFGEILAEIE